MKTKTHFTLLGMLSLLLLSSCSFLDNNDWINGYWCNKETKTYIEINKGIARLCSDYQREAEKYNMTRDYFGAKSLFDGLDNGDAFEDFEDFGDFDIMVSSTYEMAPKKIDKVKAVENWIDEEGWKEVLNTVRANRGEDSDIRFLGYSYCEPGGSLDLLFADDNMECLFTLAYGVHTEPHVEDNIYYYSKITKPILEKGLTAAEQSWKGLFDDNDMVVFMANVSSWGYTYHLIFHANPSSDNKNEGKVTYFSHYNGSVRIVARYTYSFDDGIIELSNGEHNKKGEWYRLTKQNFSLQYSVDFKKISGDFWYDHSSSPWSMTAYTHDFDYSLYPSADF